MNNMSDVVHCRECKFSTKSAHVSYTGKDGWHCHYGFIPSHYVLEGSGTCKDGVMRDTYSE